MTDAEVILRVRGEVDLTSFGELRDAIDACAGGSHRLVLDLEQVSFMDSTGIKTLLRAYRRQGRLREAVVVRNPSSAVRQVLELAGLAELIAVEWQAAEPGRARIWPADADPEPPTVGQS